MIDFNFRHKITYGFVLAAVLIALLSLLFSNRMTTDLAEEERNKIEIWAKATMVLGSEADADDMSLVLHILQSNQTIPVILYDEASGSYYSNNIKLPEKGVDDFLRKKTEQFAKRREPIELSELNQYLYYDDSYTLRKLQVYPFVQLGVIALFIVLAFFALHSSLKAEQNRVWVGLSKETAHQLGTPISSLMAWTELLKMDQMDASMLQEMEKDVQRLEMIANRFSKIGSATDLVETDLREVVDESVGYMRRRLSSRVQINQQFTDEAAMVKLNTPLFEWVIENLLKNAVDALGGEGGIDLTITKQKCRVILDVKDEGKGIPRSQFKSLFNPGYTTKERGWGLGLSLAKRIVEEYHGGKIFIKESVVGQGTTIRIVL